MTMILHYLQEDLEVSIANVENGGTNQEIAEVIIMRVTAIAIEEMADSEITMVMLVKDQEVMRITINGGIKDHLIIIIMDEIITTILLKII